MAWISIAFPADQYRLDRLLRADIDPKTGKSRAGFETVEQCVIEDGGRALGLRNISRHGRETGQFGGQPIPELQDLPDDLVPTPIPDTTPGSFGSHTALRQCCPWQ